MLRLRTAALMDYNSSLQLHVKQTQIDGMCIIETDLSMSLDQLYVQVTTQKTTVK